MSTNPAVLNLQILRAPLASEDYQTILAEYNRLTGAAIPMQEFVHWVQEAPDGPAWHGVLRNDENRVVGHTSVLPLRARHRETSMVTGFSEYSFLHEDFRKHKIRGYEQVSRPAFIILLGELFQHCQKQGWGPIFASTNEKNRIFTRKVGLRPAEFPLWECLLVLKPRLAVRHTPNITTKDRIALGLAGLAQSGLWTFGRHFVVRKNGVHPVATGTCSSWPCADRLTFYEEEASARWRYLPGQYLQYAIEGAPHDYLFAKHGRPDRYIRVCQYHLSAADSVNSVFYALMNQAHTDKAMGIRWAVYRDGELAEDIVRRLKQLGFLCAPRTRTVMVHKDYPEYLESSSWKMSDTHFALDP